ncbi:MAG TPA: diacylglycerol kinase family lipid kinase [Cyclobacteriaceae bacterium]|nr:diacylglycerol kinase family lipid kinase [Cyclobacteriaceae bacterium]HPW61521.1 diacylglycerol kinase family lipid kinase [Cyclobacteriaceae bacterium]
MRENKIVNYLHPLIASEKLKIAIILNGISTKKKTFYQSILPPLKKEFSVEVFETKSATHAFQLAGETATNHFDIILAAGGDGTLNQVLNGTLSIAGPLPFLGVIPLGSGNDFAALMNVRPDASQLINLITSRKSRPIDVGKISCRGKEGGQTTRYFINVCSMGMGPATVQRIERLPRWLGPGLRYFTSVLNTFLTHPIERFEVTTKDWTWKGKARVVAIANGKSFGNKIYIAPDAEPDDGLFNTLIATDMPLPKFLLTLQRLKSRQRVKDYSIIYGTTKELLLSSPTSAFIEAEGEMAGYLPANIEMLKNRIQFLA